MCFSDPNNLSGKPCTGAPDNWSGGGGTSFATPIWAGIQALINQNAGVGPQGLPNYRLYELANSEYGAPGNSNCNSSTVAGIGSPCIFYDVTLGDNNAPCSGPYDCYDPGGNYGVLSTLNNAYAPAYKATTGWDFATGLGTVNVANLVTAWPYPKSLATTHDFDDSYKSDILFENSGGTVALWLMHGSAPPVSGTVATVSAATYAIIGQRDFNGDSCVDILWRDTTGNLYMWFMDGMAILSTAPVGYVSNDWTVYGTGDMNGDGKGDILWRNTAGDVAVWFMNGNRATSTVMLGNVPPSWTIIGSDANGGIIWRDTSGNIAVWKVTGAGTLIQSNGIGTLPSNWQLVGVGDFNGDGYVDLLWRDNNTEHVGVWFLNDVLAVQSTVHFGVIPSWVVVQTGDYNGDGSSDILWRDSGSDLAIWFMDGAQVTSVGLGNVVGWSVEALNAE